MYGPSVNFRNYWGLGAPPPQVIVLLIGMIILVGVIWWQWKNRAVRRTGLVILACTAALAVYQLLR
ncbi:hypothetical protein [Ferrovibrio terrae]|uniref:hypothetical protein n=1 Tax=Ferrovibrio terrae TaxID=2594003 RepID=UPI003137B895